MEKWVGARGALSERHRLLDIHYYAIIRNARLSTAMRSRHTPRVLFITQNAPSVLPVRACQIMLKHDILRKSNNNILSSPYDFAYFPMKANSNHENRAWSHIIMEKAIVASV